MTQAIPADVFRGYCLPELQDAFDKVAPADDWRGPIDAKCWEIDREVIEAAIAYFTGCKAQFKVLPGPQGHGALGFRLKVTAAGYRMGPAGA